MKHRLHPHATKQPIWGAGMEGAVTVVVPNIQLVNKFNMKTDSNKIANPTSINELVQEMEKHPDLYQHLRIFLGRESNTGIPDFGEQYLAVSHDGFALYRLDSVDYQDGRIFLSLKEATTDIAVTHTLDINEEHPRCLFIRWRDIWDIVLDDILRSNVDDIDLLELIE